MTEPGKVSRWRCQIVRAWGVSKDEAAARFGHTRQPPGAAAPRPDQSGRLGRLRRTLRLEDLRVVPPLEPAGGGRPGRHPERAAQTGREDARLRVRPVAQLPRLAQDSDPPRLERLPGGAAAARPG